MYRQIGNKLLQCILLVFLAANCSSVPELRLAAEINNRVGYSVAQAGPHNIPTLAVTV